MIAAILARITDDPLGLLLTAVSLAALWSFLEWAIARADVSSLHDDIYGDEL